MRRGRVEGAWLSADKEEGILVIDVLSGKKVVNSSAAGSGQRCAAQYQEEERDRRQNRWSAQV